MISIEYEEGIDAYWNGEDINQNPYTPSDGGSFSDWIEGFNDAKKEDES